MTAALLVAGLGLFIGAAHSYLGERHVLGRLLRLEQLPAFGGSQWFARRTLRFAWHLTSLAWLGLCLVPLAQRHDPGFVGAVVSVTFALTAITTAAATRGRHLAWIVFAAIAIAAWAGA